MKTLFLDTSSFFVTIAILDGDNLIHEHIEKNDNKLSDRIFTIIENSFAQAKIKPKEVNRVFVTNGPGSFTGIRIGLTIAKTMAWSLKIPVFTVSSLELMVSGSKTDAVAIIKDRNDYVYMGAYDKELNQVVKDRYCPVDEVDILKYSVYSYDEFDFLIEKPKFDILKIIKKHENDEYTNPHLLAPNYLKDTEAEKSVKIG